MAGEVDTVTVVPALVVTVVWGSPTSLWVRLGRHSTARTWLPMATAMAAATDALAMVRTNLLFMFTYLHWMMYCANDCGRSRSHCYRSNAGNRRWPGCRCRPG